MTVAGRRPPSRWSWSIAFGALTMVSRSGISRWYLPADAVRRSARSAEPFPGGGERGGDPPGSCPTDDVARRERAVDRGGVTECVSDAGVPRECHGYGVAAPAQRTSDHRVRGGVERDAGPFRLPDERPDDVVGDTERHAAPDQCVRDGRRCGVPLARGIRHPSRINGERRDETCHDVERGFVDRDRVEQRRDAILEVALVREREALE